MQESLLVGLVRVGPRMDAHMCWFLKVWESERGWFHRACSAGTEIRAFFHPEEEFLLKLCCSLEISGRVSPWLISIPGGKGWGGKGKNGLKGGL